jgi:hypothetical protein
MKGRGLMESQTGTASAPQLHTLFGKNALDAGPAQAAPEPRVIGHGLQHIPAALQTQRSGV